MGWFGACCWRCKRPGDSGPPPGVPCQYCESTVSVVPSRLQVVIENVTNVGSGSCDCAADVNGTWILEQTDNGPSGQCEWRIDDPQGVCSVNHVRAYLTCVGGTILRLFVEVEYDSDGILDDTLTFSVNVFGSCSPVNCSTVLDGPVAIGPNPPYLGFSCGVSYVDATATVTVAA